MKTQITIVFLALLLAACAPPQTIPVDTQNTAMAIVQTDIALTQAALPTSTLPPPTFTPTATIVYSTPSLLPPLPPLPIFTPDAIQVERWQEYQTELAKVLLSGYGPDLYKYALCEWDILGRSGQELYVWAFCAIPGGGNGRLPSVIHLKADGSVQNVEVPSRGSTWEADINRMFPSFVEEKFDTYNGNSLFYGRLKEMIDHVGYREAHPEEPPLVILSFTPTAMPIP